MKGLAPLLAALAVLVSSSAGALGLPGDGPAATVLHVNIEKDEVALNHSYDEQKVSLNGSVLVDFVYLVTVYVALSVSTDLGWPCSIVPAEMTFLESVTQFFNATVKVPAGTVNRSAILTVRGNATVTPGIPGDTASDAATIIVGGGTGGGDGNGTTGIPRGRPAPTGVFVPPMPLIMVAAVAAAIGFTAYLLWYWKREPARAKGKKGTKGGK